MGPPPLLFAVGLVLVSGCAGLPPPPTQPGMPRAASPPGLDPGAAPDFGLQPGDQLDVTLETTPPRSYTGLVVEAVGGVDVPGLGPVEVRGLGLVAAEARVEGALRRLDRLGRVRVRLASPDGQRATVLGAIARPGPVAVVPGMRVSALLSAAGGPATTPHRGTGAPIVLADLSQAVLVRGGQRLAIDVGRAMRGDPRHDIYVQPGDHVFLPYYERPTVSVSGQVAAPSAMGFYDGISLAEALGLAGGVTADGDKSDIRLVRGPVDEPVVYRADLEAITRGEAGDVRLAPGDHIFVTDDPIEDFREVMFLLSPLLAVATTAVLLSVVLTP